MMSTVAETTVRSAVTPTTGTLTLANRWDHFLARVGWRRNRHRVEPGLYALGHPTADSPVFVTANYTLSFDALRSALVGTDGYILVLDTRGINVWCAAGKGTFGTDELVRRIELTQLRDVVGHRVLILPQLGAPGVAAHEVKKRSTFKVEYGPVLAADLPGYLRTHKATPEMRRVRFPLKDRAVLIPVELSSLLVLFSLLVLLLRLVTADAPAVPSAAFLSAILGGVVLFPLSLPWIPTRDFSSKGFVLGGLVALPFVMWSLLEGGGLEWWRQVAGALSVLLIGTSITAFLALNFTGATTFTSRSGVRREIFTYIPIMAGLGGIGIVSRIVLSLV
jgi:hypothetical protein